MARTRSSGMDALKQREEKLEKAISRNRERYDRLTAELEEIHKKEKTIQNEVLLKAIGESSRSYEEILQFLQDEANAESE